MISEIIKELENLLNNLAKTAFAQGDTLEVGKYRGIIEALDIVKKHANDGWHVVADGDLPKEKENPITRDYYEYQVTICICGKHDLRYYKFGRGSWWNGGANMDSIVIAWRELPEPYIQK